jgi:preprotein translocase subunit SecG
VVLSHFSAALLFSLFTSVVFGVTQRSTPRAMARYGAWCFLLFLLAIVVLSWVMYFIRR